MEKSLAAPTEKVSNHIYDDVALVILSKLPLKSLFRFCCVHKSWSILFQNPYFMNLLRKNFLSKDHSYYEDTSLLLHHSTEVNYTYKLVLYSLFGERFQNRVKLDWPNPYDEPFVFLVHGSASVNGILCIQDAGRADDLHCIEDSGRVVLWNPATEEFKVTPTSPFVFVESPYWYSQFRVLGFGYDQVEDDYKVIRDVMFCPIYDREITNEDSEEMWKDGYPCPLWEIYSLKSNSWRKLDIDIPTRCYTFVGVQLYMDGVCHWWGESQTSHNVYLVSFELNNEVYVETSIPSNMDIVSRPMFRHLFVLNGSIAWISSNCAKTPAFHISVLGEVGIKESWIKLFIVGPLLGFERPIGIGKKGDIFFRKKDDELVLFDLSTQRIEKLGIKGGTGCHIMVYKESLLSILKE